MFHHDRQVLSSFVIIHMFEQYLHDCHGEQICHNSNGVSYQTLVIWG